MHFLVQGNHFYDCTNCGTMLARIAIFITNFKSVMFMIRWFSRIAGILFVLMIGVFSVEYFQKGYFKIPDMPEGSYVFSNAKTGFRGVVLNPEVSHPIRSGPKMLRTLTAANFERRYIPIEANVPTFFKTSWSVCKAPSPQEKKQVRGSMPVELSQQLASARFDSVCRINVDGTEVVRGWLFSVPRL